VPLPEYRSLIELFATGVTAGGARAIVVGLPSALAVGDVPEYLTGDGFTPSAAAAVDDHARYLDAAREASAAAGATFVDAATAMGRTRACSPVTGSTFRPRGMPLSQCSWPGRSLDPRGGRGPRVRLVPGLCLELPEQRHR
jgi:hypothetical protein